MQWIECVSWNSSFRNHIYKENKFRRQLYIYKHLFHTRIGSIPRIRFVHVIHFPLFHIHLSSGTVNFSYARSCEKVNRNKRAFAEKKFNHGFVPNFEFSCIKTTDSKKNIENPRSSELSLWRKFAENSSIVHVVYLYMLAEL